MIGFLGSAVKIPRHVSKIGMGEVIIGKIDLAGRVS
jgi:hypothetical protein